MENKKQIIITITISVVLSVLFSLIIVAWANNEVRLSDFKVESFNMETEKTTYKYSEDSVTYEGNGIITCKNKDYDYIVLVERKNKTKNETDYISTEVHNGIGEISTYDYGDLETTEKPEYEFNIIGYRSFKK